MTDSSAQSYVTPEQAEAFHRRLADESLCLGLGYEQIRALSVIAESPPQLGYELCRLVDMSFAELFALHEQELITVDDIEAEKVVRVTGLTELGHQTLAAAQRLRQADQ